MQSLTDDIPEDVRELFEPLSHHEIVDKLEAAMRSIPEHHIEFPLQHFHAKGTYAREIFIPKGSTLTGKIHKHSCINVISQGKIEVITHLGRIIIQAPYTFVSEAGTRRAAYAHEDTIWTTIHQTDETDLKKIEQELVVTTHDQYLEFQKQKELECHS